MNKILGTVVFVVGLMLIACGGSHSTGNSSSSSSGGTGPAGNTTPVTSSVLGTKVNFTYQFTVATDSNSSALSTAVKFPDGFTVPLYIQSDGTVSMKAGDFPRMVLRVCRTGSSTEGCDYHYDPVKDGITDSGDVDLVFDACSASSDAGCGDADTGLFKGVLKSDGTMSVSAIAIRIRVFAVTPTLDGFSATDAQGGLLSLPRMVTAITTGGPVSTGVLTGTGSPVANNAVILVGAGVVPPSMPNLGGVAFLSTITGTFDVNPLSLLK